MSDERVGQGAEGGAQFKALPEEDRLHVMLRFLQEEAFSGRGVLLVLFTLDQGAFGTVASTLGRGGIIELCRQVIARMECGADIRLGQNN